MSLISGKMERETEIRGVPLLQRLCDAIFAGDGAKPAPAADAPQLREAATS